MTYLRLWREWVRNQNNYNLHENYITREAAQDVILSCHFAILLIKLFRDHYPGQKIPFDRCGSDVCEAFFSSLGSFTLNKRTYSLLEAIQTARAQLLTAKALARGNIRKQRKHFRRKPVWDEDVGVPEADMLDWPTDAIIVTSFSKGRLEAYKLAVEDRMNPGDRRPQWWAKPHEFDHKDSIAGGDDDELSDAEASDNDNDAGDGDDEDSDDDSNDENKNIDEANNEDEDDAEAMSEECLAALDAVGLSGKKTTQMITKPDGTRVHKSAALVELAGHGTSGSADRGLRV
jgi:hypothetical protein